MLLVSSCSCLYPIRWSQVLSWEWRWSWSSADRRCSNYIWVINNLIANQSVSYIRDLTAYFSLLTPFLMFKISRNTKLERYLIFQSGIDFEHWCQAVLGKISLTKIEVFETVVSREIAGNLCTDKQSHIQMVRQPDRCTPMATSSAA